jgi:nucleoside-diphosphate-sugar epimerase
MTLPFTSRGRVFYSGQNQAAWIGIPSFDQFEPCMKHTVLGAGGAVGIALSHELSKSALPYRLVQRQPQAVTGSPLEELLATDLTQSEAVDHAVQGSSVVYLTIGFPYRLATWKANWPKLIVDVVQACEKHNARLVFFDNVYALGTDQINPVTEESVINPPSKKGAVRADLDRYIMDRVEKGKLSAIIARAPDFFTEHKQNSMLMALIYDNLKKGKKAQWLANADMPHSTGYVPDLARGVAMLGQSTDTFNQVWNLPVSPIAPTAKEWSAMFAREMGLPDNGVTVLPKWLVRGLGLFIPVLGETVEMMYQYDRPYVFDSSKFNKRFAFTPLTPGEAVNAVVQRLQTNTSALA